MKMWTAPKGATGTLFVFSADGRMERTISRFKLSKAESFDDGDVVDHIRLFNNERQAFSNYGSFPSHLYPGGVKVVMGITITDKGAAFVRKGLKGERTYILVLPQGEYDCLC